MSPIARKNRMRLLSSLYEVAARFSERELLEILNESVDDELLGKFVSAFLELNEQPVGVQPKAIERIAKVESRDAAVAPPRREAALKELLMSKEVFHSPKDIASAFPIKTALRPKESREKYVNRLLVNFRELSAMQQGQFVKAVHDHVAFNSKGNFVSRWSRLIREL